MTTEDDPDYIRIMRAFDRLEACLEVTHKSMSEGLGDLRAGIHARLDKRAALRARSSIRQGRGA
jgi:hypothetical protein